MEGQKVASTLISVSLKLCIFSICAVLIFFLGRTAYDFGIKIFNESAMAEDGQGVDVEVVIPRGSSEMDVAKIMEQKGLTESSLLFYVQIKLVNYNKTIVPGAYVLNTEMLPSEILEAISPEPEEETTEAATTEAATNEAATEAPGEATAE